MAYREKTPALALVLSLAASLAIVATPAARADDAFAVESFSKYDSEAASYMAPSSVNFFVVKKGTSDFVIWTRGELDTDQLTVIEAYARHADPSLQGRNAIFLSGLGKHPVDTMYGTITFEEGEYGLIVSMPRKWSHLDYGRYTDNTVEPEPEPDPDPEPASLTITKTVNGGLWRVKCDYMDVEGHDTYKVLHINNTEWKRDWIKNPGGITSKEGHRLNKCGEAENWVIWTTNGVASRMDEIKSGSTGSTLPTVAYRPRVEMSDEQIAQIGNPDHPEYVTNYMKNFQDPMPYSEIQVGKRMYWITFNGNQVWYHSGIPYETDPSFVLSVDGVEYTLTGGASVTIPDLEPGIHEISESANPLYTLGKVVSSTEGIHQDEKGWSAQIVVNPGDDIQVVWPNIQPAPRDPPTPPAPPHIEAEPEPEPETPVVPTLCELLDLGKRFNAVIFGNLTTSGGDSEGNLLVWGNATLPIGYTVAMPVVGESIPEAGARDDALIVAGDLLIGQQDVNGNIVYGGAYLGDDRRWNDYALRHVNPVTIDRAGNVPADKSGRTAADLLAAVKEVSSSVAEFDANGTISYDIDGSLILTGTNETRNVFSVTAEEWSGLQRDWIFDVPSGSKIIVNVTGSSVDIEKGCMVLPNGVSQKDILVNYIDATLLDFSNFDHLGTVLAPFASASFNGGAIEGMAFIGGDVVAKEGFEFHNFGLDVFFCPPMPGITVTVTAAAAADGDIWNIRTGSEVAVTNIVSNNGDFWLRAVSMTDSTGATFALGDIAPGGSVKVVKTIAGEADGLVAYTATVAARAYASADASVAFASRPSVTASDVALVNFSSAASASGEAGTGAIVNPGAYVPTERVDYEVADMWFSCIPTFAGETFTVNVRVKNNGEVDGNGAFLGLYLVGIEHKPTIADGEDIEPVRSVEMGGIPAGGSRVYSFGGLTAPDASGVCRVIAYADMHDTDPEWSPGDNQNNLTYELSQVSIRIELAEDGVTIVWSNGWGQKYSILGSNDLENWEPVITDIPSWRDTQGLVENVQTVGFDTGYKFFKLRIDQR